MYIFIILMTEFGGNRQRIYNNIYSCLNEKHNLYLTYNNDQKF